MRARGFTLIEILVAIVIFSLIGVAAYSTLDAAQGAQATLRDRGARFQQFAQALTLISRDYRQISLRRTRDAYGERLPLLRTRCEPQSCFLEFTRSGWRNPAELPRATIEHVIYKVEDGVLNRYSSPVLDQAREDQLVKRELLRGVKNLRIDYLPPEGEGASQGQLTGADNLMWVQGEWPKGGRVNEADAVRLPRAIKLSFELDGIGEVSRVLP